MLLFELIIIYILLVFVMTRLVVPHFGFSPFPVSQKIPVELQQKINELKLSAESFGTAQDKEFLKSAYEFVTTKHHGERIKTLTEPWLAWQDPLSAQPGFTPCNISNQLLRTMLVVSGKFQNEDVQVRYTFLNFFIHQYLQVKVNDKWIDVDPWAKALGIEFGKHANLFL